jgi:LacI family transcriptional regulator
MAILPPTMQSSKGKRPTLRDVAELVGVDPSLVSRVVNNDPKSSASEATRKRILDAVDLLGYQASVMARGFRMTRTWTLGLLLPDLFNPMYASIVGGVEQQAQSQGYGVVVGVHDENEGKNFTELLRQGRVDGLLIASGVLKDDELRRVIASGVGPVVLVNRRVRGIRASVVVDDESGAKLAVDHLRDLGHRNIGGMFGPTGVDTSVRRKKGFIAGCRDMAPASRPTLDMPSWNYVAGYEGALELLNRKKRPSGIFASTLAMGIGTLRAARELNIQIPHDLSVIALHDSEIANYLDPPLTTVAMPAEEMGREAVEMLVSLIDGGPSREVIVGEEAKLVLRESTGPTSQ